MMKFFIYLGLLFSTQLYASDFADLVQMRGKVWVQRGKTIIENISIPFALEKGDFVNTGPSSYAKVKIYPDANCIISTSSQIKIDQLKDTQTTSLEMLKGRFRASLTPVQDSTAKKELRLYIKTKSASAGVRGTDFEMSYNEQNDITSVLSYSGELKVKKNHEMEWPFTKINQLYDAIYNEQEYASLTPSKFTGSFPGFLKVSDEVKISPVQFYFLKNHDPFKDSPNQTSKNEHLKNLDIKPIAPEKYAEQKNIPLRPLPRQWEKDLDPVLKWRPDIKKQGGYLDLETGIYVSPPKDAEYDKDSDTYVTPKEFGGVNIKTGDYVPPMGLFLHPLKGFISAATAIKDSAKYVGKKMISGITYTGEMLKDGILYTGDKVTSGIIYTGQEIGRYASAGATHLVDGVVYGASTIKDGIIFGGTVLKDGVFYTGGKIKDGLLIGANVIKDTLVLTKDGVFLLADTVAYTAIEGPKKMAEFLNEQLYDNVLMGIRKNIKDNPFLAKLVLNLSADYKYDSNVLYPFYEQTLEVSNVASMVSRQTIEFGYQQLVYGDYYLRPSLDYSNNHYFNDSAEFYNYRDMSLNLDLGIKKRIFSRPLKLNLRLFKEKQWREDLGKDTFYTFTKARGATLDFYYRILPFLTPKFFVTYLKNSSSAVNHGSLLKFKGSQILSLPYFTFVEMSLEYSERKSDIGNFKLKTYGPSFSILKENLFWSWDLSLDVSYLNLDHLQSENYNGREKKWDIKINLEKKWTPLVETSAFYEFSTQEGNSAQTLDYTKGVFGIKVDFNYL